MAAPNFIRRLAQKIFKLTPYLPQEELKTRLSPEVQAAVADLARKQQANLHRLTEELGRENANTEWKSVEGLGQKIGSIPLEVIHQLAAAHGRTVESVMNDSDFIRSILRKNPAFQVKTTRGTKGQSYIKPGRVNPLVLQPIIRNP